MEDIARMSASTKPKGPFGNGVATDRNTLVRGERGL